VREDIKKPGLLYAGTEHGVYVSFDDGKNWQSLQLNLPNTQVADLVVTENDLVVGTHGRSIYVLDEVGPLREYKPDMSTDKVVLFKPSNAVRRVQNALFQYYLPSGVDSVKVEIMDSTGKLIKSFTGKSAAAIAAAKPKDSTVAGDAAQATGGRRARADSAALAPEEQEDGPVRIQRPPGVAVGINQFEWDLRYPGATEFPGMIMWGARPQNGPLAVPGKYSVKFTAGGQTFTEPFEIKADPRLKNVSIADMKEQFKLAMELRDKVSEANGSVVQIRAIKATLNNKKVKSATDQKLLSQLTTIEEELYQVRNQSGQDPLNFPIKINNRIAALWRSVETGDSKPTAGSYEISKQLSADLEKQITELKKITVTKKAF
jgi:hypothetical protein